MSKSKTALREASAQQDGQFATRQAHQLGIGRHALATMGRSGEIVQQRFGVWRFAAAPGTADPAVTAALACWPHAVISHASAATFHTLTRVKQPELPQITLPHGIVSKLPGIGLHWSRSLTSDDVLAVGGVRYTSLARTGCDLANGDEPWETLALVDDLMAKGARRPWVHRTAKRLANGRSGVTLIRDATDPRAADEFRSWLERAAAYVFQVAGLPEPRWNVEVRDQKGRIGIVDALWLPWNVVSEMEGLRFHTTPTQRRRDAQRFNRLLDAGLRPRRFTWEDVVHRPVDVAEQVFRVLRAAGADLDPVRIPRRIVVPSRPFA